MKSIYKKTFISLCFCSLSAFSSIANVYALETCNNLTPEISITFIDVGLGDATLIQCLATNEAILIDAGPSNAEYPAANTNFKNTLKNKLKGKLNLDYLISTHPHPDHLYGFLNLVQDNNFNIKTFIDSGLNFNNSKLESGLRDIIFSRRISYLNQRQQALNTIEFCKLNGKVSFARLEFLNLSARDEAKLNCQVDINNCSLVSKLTYANQSVLLMADAGKAREELLIKNPLTRNFLPSTVLKVGHHASSHASSAEFLATVNPLFAIISTGKPNTGRSNELGYPAFETLERLNTYFNARFAEDNTNKLWACRREYQACRWQELEISPRIFSTQRNENVSLGIDESRICIIK